MVRIRTTNDNDDDNDDNNHNNNEKVDYLKPMNAINKMVQLPDSKQ